MIDRAAAAGILRPPVHLDVEDVRMDEPPVDIVDRPTRRRARVVVVDVDICHACGPGSASRAYLFARLSDGDSRAYCGHHGRKFLTSPEAVGAKIIDRLDEIEP